MTKRIFITIFMLNGIVSFSFGQNAYSWYDNKKIVYKDVPGKLLITFRRDISRESILKFQMALPVNKNSADPPQIFDHSIIYQTSTGKTAILRTFEKNREIVTVTSFFSAEKGVEQAASDEFFVKLKQKGDTTILQRMLTERKVKIISMDKYTPNLFLLQCPRGKNAMDEANSWAETKLFSYAEPNFVFVVKTSSIKDKANQSKVVKKLPAPTLTTNDEFQNRQWALQNTGQIIFADGSGYGSATPGCDMRVKKAWKINTGSSNVKIAILDIGVDLSQPDLVDNLIGGYDATDGHSGCGTNGGYCNTENDFHGTACAGVAAASADNAIGVAGVAFGCKIIPIRVAHTTGPGESWLMSSATASSGINWAWANGADILSNSWYIGQASVIDDAIQNAVVFGRGGLGSIVLFASGNNNSTVSYPARNPNVIAVGAMSPCEERKSPESCDFENWGSNYGTTLDVAAPGVWIYTTDITGATGYSTTNYLDIFNGTSSACPNTAGVVALILSQTGPLTPGLQVRNILEQSCRKAGAYTYTANIAGQPNGTWSNELGYGMVDAYAALLKVIDNGCASDWTINGNLSTNEQYEAANTVTGTCTINNGNYVVFDAGNKVTLKPGFKVSPGSYFIARINGCGGAEPQ